MRLWTTRGRVGFTPERTLWQRLARALAGLGAVLSVGTAGYMALEGWDPLHALFFTMITITTVGYGDYGLSRAGEAYTLVVILAGFGLFTYCCGQAVEAMANEQFMRRRRMHRLIRSLRDHLIVCGLGRMGWSVAERLSEMGATFVVIDRDQESVDRALGRGWLAITGDSTDDAILREATVEHARALIAAAGSDTDNIVITLSAHGINPGLLILSRAEEASAIRKLKRAGATKVVSPIGRGASHAVDSILKPHLAQLLDSASSEEAPIEMAEITISEGMPESWRCVATCGQLHPSVAFVAVKRTGEEELCFRVRPRERLEPGDVLIVAGERDGVCAMTMAAREMNAAA
jgi:voltage-gated potassium channel